MKKKLVCVMTAFVMAAAVGCGGSKDAKSPAAETTKAETTAAETKKEETTAAETTKEETTEAPTEAKEEGPAFQTGTWDELVFTNPWLGLTLTFPEDSYVCTEEEVQAVLGAGQEVLVNNGNYTEAQLKLSEATTVYDFMVVLPDGQSNIQLAYENIKLTAGGMDISAEDYLNIVWEQVSKIADMQYKKEGEEKVDLAGQSFAKLSASLMEGALYQDYYSICLGDHMVTMTVSYVPESKDVVNELIAGITAAQ